MFTFLPTKRKFKTRKFSIFCPSSFQTGREKNLVNSPGKNCDRELNNKIKPEKKKCQSKKIKKISVEIQKFLNFCPGKINEKKHGNVPEKIWNAEKILKR